MKRALKIIGLIVLVLLVICFVIGIITTTSANDFEYSINHSTNTVTITGLAPSKSNKRFIDIPQKIKGYPVTSIAEDAFKGNEKILTVELPKTISYIGKGAFENCKNLKSVSGLEKCSELKTIEDNVFCGCNKLKKIKLPSNITSIGSYAFRACNIQKLSLPKTVAHIGKSAFDNCQSLKEFVIPEGVTLIQSRTFFACKSLTKITIPSSVKNIATEVFDYNTSLKEIYVDPNNSIYASVDGVLYSKDITQLIHFPAAKKGETFSVPETVTIIKQCSFALSVNLKSLNIPRSVTSMENSIFIDSSIENIYYDGTVDKWNKIFKSRIWDTRSPSFTIHCTDGQIAKDGTVTYK